MSDINFDRELEQAMQEIQDNITGEIWQDIKAMLTRERDEIRRIDSRLAEVAQSINADVDGELQALLELAAPETEAQFWRKLNIYRMNLDVADDAIGEIRQQATNARSWLRPYIIGFLCGCGEQVDSLR